MRALLLEKVLLVVSISVYFSEISATKELPRGLQTYEQEHHIHPLQSLLFQHNAHM